VYWLANLGCYGFGEEVGWRGVLLPRLQSRMAALPATAIVAAVWTVWHIPLFSFVDGYVSMTAAGAGLVVLVRYGSRNLAPATRQMDHDDATVGGATEAVRGH